MRFSSIHDTYTFWFILNILYIILWYDYGRCPNFKEIVNVILHDLCTNDILGLPLPIPSRPRQIFIDDVWLWCNFARRMLGGGGPLYKCPSSLFMWCILYITHYLTPLLLIPFLYLLICPLRKPFQNSGQRLKRRMRIYSLVRAHLHPLHLYN